MEYKGDERWMFEHALRIPALEPWPALGMPSGVGLRNPGLSVSLFAALARITGARDPLSLCRAVVALNGLAFVLLFLAAWRLLPVRRREAWGWALALAAVSPISVLLQRKIWAQSVLPVFCAGFLVGWLRRERWWGAALWGLAGALLGQIHMSGFFLAAAFLLCEVGLGRLRRARVATRWPAWLAGTLAGAWPLLPWVRYVLETGDARRGGSWGNVASLRFYRSWISDSLGLGLDYSLGPHYLDFLRHPLFGTRDLYPALYLHGAAFAIGASLLYGWGRSVWSARRELLRAPAGPLAALSEEGFTVLAAFAGFGALLTLSGVFVHRHYLIVTFPLEWLMLALLALRYTPRPRVILSLLWVAQLALSLTFLHYIHVNHGAPGGDYGKVYRAGAMPRDSR